MSDTPRTDEFISSRQTWPWQGNETQVLMAAVFARDSEWAQFARKLESELRGAKMAAGYGEVSAREALDPERPPRPGLSQKFVDKVTSEDADDEPPVMGRGLAKSAHEAAAAPPPPPRSHAPNPRNAVRKKKGKR